MAVFNFLLQPWAWAHMLLSVMTPAASLSPQVNGSVLCIRMSLWRINILSLWALCSLLTFSSSTKLVYWQKCFSWFFFWSRYSCCCSFLFLSKTVLWYSSQPSIELPWDFSQLESSQSFSLAHFLRPNKPYKAYSVEMPSWRLSPSDTSLSVISKCELLFYFYFLMSRKVETFLITTPLI